MGLGECGIPCLGVGWGAKIWLVVRKILLGVGRFAKIRLGVKFFCLVWEQKYIWV